MVEITPERRLEGLATADPSALVALADEVLATFDVRVTRGPVVGAMMVRVEEPVEGLTFNFIEVTASEAEVQAGDERGYGIILGIAPDQALAAAVLDAAVAADHPLSDRVVELLETGLRREAAAWAATWSDVSPTRVRFDETTR